MIGSIVETKCQEVLGKQPLITIDSPTRLALSIEATETEFNRVISALPQEIRDTWELLCPPSQFEGKLYVEMRPTPPPARDLEAEVDEIKAKIADYDELKAKVETLEKK